MPCHFFGWQGGEPMLIWLDFFCQGNRIDETIQVVWQRFSNGLQTNGTMSGADFSII
jgi:sulfatase maturation enzyme AslB (radical SAM superfamily)